MFLVIDSARVKVGRQVLSDELYSVFGLTEIAFVDIKPLSCVTIFAEDLNDLIEGAWIIFVEAAWAVA